MLFQNQGNPLFLLTPLREGRLQALYRAFDSKIISTHAPAGGAACTSPKQGQPTAISTHAPAGGATQDYHRYPRHRPISTHAPAGGATRISTASNCWSTYFYSRPCGRGDHRLQAGLPHHPRISTHAPAGGATVKERKITVDFRPISTHAPAGGATYRWYEKNGCGEISTHAPAGGATAIFHKSVMRFCGKLPKDDTVLCLASFGFPRRDPKAVYLAWISCANLPQKCVREGLALKDQGTSCFHEGLASHAFDPVLV